MATTIAITAQGVASSINLVVDGEGPEIQRLQPGAGQLLAAPSSVNFSFDVRDDGAGLRHDGEFETSGDGDPRVVNVDGDQLTSQEPRSTSGRMGRQTSTPTSAGKGRGAPIDITPYGNEPMAAWSRQAQPTHSPST